MCWNKEISLNTFIFSIGSILFIYYVNTYTRYKSNYFNEGIFRYIFILSFSLMQLIEYFLWKSIENNDKIMNYTFSLLGFILILGQPIASIMLLSSKLQNRLLPIYIFFICIYLILRYIFDPIVFKTTIGEHGHLSWNWLENKYYWEIIIFIWLGFLLYTEKIFIIPLIGISVFLYTYFKYKKSNEWGSIWCWLINSICLYLLFDVLIVVPYYKNELC